MFLLKQRTCILTRRYNYTILPGFEPHNPNPFVILAARDSPNPFTFIKNESYDPFNTNPGGFGRDRIRSSVTSAVGAVQETGRRLSNLAETVGVTVFHAAKDILSHPIPTPLPLAGKPGGVISIAQGEMIGVETTTPSPAISAVKSGTGPDSRRISVKAPPEVEEAYNGPMAPKAKIVLPVGKRVGVDSITLI